jgi:hypothetical protein
MLKLFVQTRYSTTILFPPFLQYLIFGGAELDHYTAGTYTPSWEDVGPALFASIVSLLMNVLLIGAAILYSRKMSMAWIAWNIVLIMLFWAW